MKYILCISLTSGFRIVDADSGETWMDGLTSREALNMVSILNGLEVAR